MTLNPKRNDPCPCKSGKKYKKCCLIATNKKRRLFPKMSMMFKLRVLPSIFIVVGALVLFFGLRGAYRAYDSVNWLFVEGVVISSKVKEYEDSDGYDTAEAEVFYQYTLNRKTYYGSNVAYGTLNSEAYAIASRYPVGRDVNVYMMPNNPDVSVLEPGLRTQVWIFPSFGLLFFTLGSLMWVLFSRASGTKKIN